MNDSLRPGAKAGPVRPAQVEPLADDEARLRLSAIVESSDDAIVSKDLNGTITSWNTGAEQIFGYTAEEVVGKSITILIPSERRDEEFQILDRIRRGKRVHHYETVRRRKNGSMVDVSLSISPIKNSKGEVIGASKIARDITKRKATERALADVKEQLVLANEDLEKQVEDRTASLQKAMEQMEEFSYSVSHDLRAPVRAMQGYARVLAEDYGDRLDEQAREYLDRIIRGGTRMDRLIQDVLTYSRLSRREMPLQPVSLEKLVREIIQQYPEMQPPRAEIAISGPLMSVQGHEPSLTQAISNLLNNAIKFIPHDVTPRVRVRTERRNQRVRLWIEDNGIGIKPEYQHRLFGMFERVHPETKYEGTGIGLAIVRKAVERMGGLVGIESDGLTGSNFWIELPAAAGGASR
jgi:PAS domain S-box-containing protein